MATTSLGAFAAQAATPATTEAAAYATQKELLKTADEALSTLTHVRKARMALFDNKIDVAKAEVADATKALTQGDTDFKAMRVADTEKTGATPEYLPFDMSMTLTDTFKATKENEAALEKAKGLMQTADKNAAIEVLRVAAVDLNITAAMLPESASMDLLKTAATNIDAKQYYEANLVLKSVEDGVIVRTFGIDAIPQQGDIE
jgi:hypothetical protein